MASKLSKREKGLLYLLLCIAITAGCVCLLILPAMSRNAALKDSLDTAEMQKMEMEIKKNTLEKHLARIEELNRTSDELYGSLFTEGMPSERYDAYLTGIALELGVTPTSLTIHAASAEKPEIYAPAGTSSAAGGEEDAEGTAVRTFQIGGSASYDAFAALVAAYDVQPQLHVSDAAYSYGGGDRPDEFMITLQIFMLESRTDVPQGQTQA